MTTYAERSLKTSSEKILLCTIEAAEVCKLFTLDSGSQYRRNSTRFISKVKQGDTYLEQGTLPLNAGEFYYSITDGIVYIRTTDSSNPNTKNITLFNKFFFSSAPINLPNDLSSGEAVEWDGRITQTGAIKQSLDDENTGIAIETSTNISLINSDGYFDSIFDKLVWENKEIKFYSWFAGLNITENKKVFDGIIESKSFSSDSVQFKCKDFTFKLREFLNLERFTSSDGIIDDSTLNTPKRRILGRVKQVKCVGVDKNLSGYSISPLAFASIDSTVVTFSSSVYGLIYQGDELLIEQEDGSYYKISVDSFNSSTSINIGSKTNISFGSAPVLVNPPSGDKNHNRDWFIAGHQLFRPTLVIEEVVSPRRFTVVEILDGEIFPDDIVDINGDKVKVKNVVGRTVITYTNVSPAPGPGDLIIKEPVMKAYIESNEIIIDRDFSATNTPEAILNIGIDAEFNIAPAKTLGANLTFTNGSRSVSSSATFDLRTLIRPRDWVRSTSIVDTTWFEVSWVGENTLLITSNFSGSSGSVSAEYKNVNLITDDSLITVDCYGLVENDIWIRTPADCVKYILENDAGLTQINEAAFTKANGQCDYIVSMALPDVVGSGLPQIRDTITKISQSCFGSLYTDNNFDLAYSILNSSKPLLLNSIKDDDIISFSVTTNNKIIRRCFVQYRPFVDIFTGENTFEEVNFSSDFVDEVVEDNREKQVICYLYSEQDANIIAQRWVFFNSLSNSRVKINSKMNLALTVLNEQMYIDLDRLYLRFGGLDRKKIGVVSSISKNGTDCEIEFNDLGNIYNRVPSICPNSSAIFASASDEDKVKWGYIVDNSIFLPDTNSEETIGLNLIG